MAVGITYKRQLATKTPHSNSLATLRFVLTLHRLGDEYTPQ